ncbi:cytochrome P-450 cyp509A1 [Zychaea mexicana]|uniref:cytochrome P-450 cyp509A1 n=1 Tax=Zychaea mexicana TaxID=64656 RepID=UPI0022FE04D8|nr:cytochrome P-450 cyp509A1 [Zychaea mexicana]KAI9493687.1 cytochrome P-450 cyp509A1 [Zychaea mexicana]
MQIVGQSTLLGRFAFGPNILILNGDKWKAQRMIANPAFHRSLPVSLFGQLTQELFCTMDTMLDSPIDFHDLMERWALDAIGRAGFDFDFHAISKPNNEWVDRYGNIMKAMMEIRYVIFPILERFFLPLLPKRRQIHKELDVFLDMLQSIIDKKRQDLSGVDLSGMNHSEKDLLTLMLEASAEGNGRMTDEEIKSNLCIFFAAGHDTTANSLSYMAYYLARHPDIQQKAREEAIKVLGNESTDILPTKDQLRNMPYINQIIKETLRINSPVAGLIGRVAAQDTDLDGVFIPKGTRVMCSLYELHHNPSVWKNPEEFNPDRFAPNGEAEKLAGIGFAWLPFSNGSRQCIGMNFSMTEQRVLLSMLLRKYELLLPEDSIHKDRIVTRGFFIVSPVDMKINCKKLY